MPSRFVEILHRDQENLLSEWTKEQLATSKLPPHLTDEGEMRARCATFLRLFSGAIGNGASTDLDSGPWRDAVQFLGQISKSRAQQGYTPSETAKFVLSLKKPVFSRLRK